MEIDVEAEVSVKDIVNFYIKINDSSKAKKDIAQLSAKDKAAALDIIAESTAGRDFRIDVARYFIYDLDFRVRKKAERFMEELVPGWVTDPAESILKLLKLADGKGEASRNSAVKFLFGIVDAGGLRTAFLTLLNGRNRAHMSEIIAILEHYIEASADEREQVKIFDACLEIIVSDDIDYNIKHHASNLLSIFFNKVSSTDLGETLKRKYIEKQVEKADGVYRYLCSGSLGLNSAFLSDLLAPLHEGGSAYQIKILKYFKLVLEKARNPEEADSVLDTYPDYWNQEEQLKEKKIKELCGRILRAVDELWEDAEEAEVRELIVRIRYGEYTNKRELLEHVRAIADEGLSNSAREKIAMMLRCFLQPDEQEQLKLQAAQLLLFTIGDAASMLAALDYLASYLENRNLNYAEKGSIATVMESLLANNTLGEQVREKARYLLFIADPARIRSEYEQMALLGYLCGVKEAKGFAGAYTEKRILESLAVFSGMPPVSEELKKTIRYLELSCQST